MPLLLISKGWSVINEPKTYVLDSSVLLNSPYAVNAFDEHTVLIPYSVVRELQGYANTGTGEVRASAAEALRILDSFAQKSESLRSGVRLPGGGLLKVGADIPGRTICEEAKEVQGTVVSRSPAIRVMANCSGISAEDYKAEAATGDIESIYNGRCRVYVTADEMDRFAKQQYLSRPAGEGWYATTENGVLLSEHYELTANEFVVLVNSGNVNGGTLLGRWDSVRKAIVPMSFYDKKAPVYGAQAKNVGQQFALEALMAPVSVAPLVILMGPAGTAKTFLSMAAGLAQTCDEHIYRRVLATRSNTEMDKTLGYLKGDEEQKLAPLMRPIFDNVENLHATDKKKGKKDGVPYEDVGRELLASGAVSLQSMGYMRGRSIKDTYIIVDEAQNMSLTQVLSMITRAGEGSKIVLLGDPDQIDNQFLDRRNNGLVFAAEKMRGSPLCWQLRFSESECTRSALAREAISRLTPKGAQNLLHLNH